MKRLFLFCVLVVLSAPVVVAGSDETPKVKAAGDGLYRQVFPTGAHSLVYLVDTAAQLCLASRGGGTAPGGMTVIPCENLARRPEWKSLLTWVEKAPQLEH